MPYSALKRFFSGILPVVALLLLLLVALHLLSGAVQNAEALNRWFLPLLVFILFGLLGLLVVVIQYCYSICSGSLVILKYMYCCYLLLVY